MRRTLTGVLALAALVSACSSLPPSTQVTSSLPMTEPDPSVAPTDARIAGWRSDLELLVSRREAIHPDPWFGIDRAEYLAAVAHVSARVPELSDNELLVEVTRLAAMPTWEGRDGHGGIYPWGEGAYPTHLYPLRLYAFSDGMFVVDAVPPYEDLVGARIDSIAGDPVDQVVDAVAPLVPRDNHQQVLSHAPRLIVTAEILHGLGLLTDPHAPGMFGLIRDGTAETRQVEPIPMPEYESWAGGHHSLSPPPRPSGAAWVRRHHDTVWWELDAATHTAFVQYNMVSPPGSVVAEARAAIEDGSVDRLVVDVRHNGGGNNTTYGSLLALVADAAAMLPGGAYVIMGRNTFSAAGNFVTEVDTQTDAVLVGEDLGTSPNQYGDSRASPLPHSGLVFRVAPQWIVKSDPEDPRITISPDIPAPISSTDYFGDGDPALDAILAHPIGSGNGS